MEDRKIEVELFSPAADDPLKPEHELISKIVYESLTTNIDNIWKKNIDFKSLTDGEALLKAKPEQSRLFVLSGLSQIQYWNKKIEIIRSKAKNEFERIRVHLLPGWELVWRSRIQTVKIISTLLRRSLPFEEEDLIQILYWCNTEEYHIPAGSVIKAINRYTKEHDISSNLMKVIHEFGIKLRKSYDKDIKRLGTIVEQVYSERSTKEDSDFLVIQKFHPVQAEVAGHKCVQVQLKRYLGLLDDDGVATETIGPDRFPLRKDSFLRDEHFLITEVFHEVIGMQDYDFPPLNSFPSGQTILSLNPVDWGRVLLASSERAINAVLGDTVHIDDRPVWQSRYASKTLFTLLSLRSSTMERDSYFDVILFMTMRPEYLRTGDVCREMREWLSEELIDKPLTEGERYVLYLMRAVMIGGPPLGAPSEETMHLTKLIGDGAQFYLTPGEVWSDMLNNLLGVLPKDKKKAWVALLKHFLTATTARPSSKWLQQADTLISAVGDDEVRTTLQKSFEHLLKGRSFRLLGSGIYDIRHSGDIIHPENATCLRGMLWVLPRLKPDAELVRAAATTAMSAYKKVPGVGPRAVKVGNAAVYALSEMHIPEAVGQLAMLKSRVKFGTAQKEIEKAFQAAARSLGLPRAEIEEIGVPTYGMEEVGVRRDHFGDDYSAELRVAGRESAITWYRRDGKSQKSVPAKVRSDYKDDLKSFQAAGKDIVAMLSAQGQRLDSMFLYQKQWPLEIWRERYLNHPLVGILARRLIWSFRSGGGEQSGIWHAGRMVDADDQPLDTAADATVSLWHPIGRAMDDILAWRACLERHEIRQPFKQAHREVYILTEAERQTRTYSNRFAAHILRQHQYNSLCAARGWKNQLRLMVDSDYPPTFREMPELGLRAEFWVESAGEDFGTDTNESGAYLYVSTDQVRFYPMRAAMNTGHASGGGFRSEAVGPGSENVNEPLLLDQISPLVFSEILRDVDLFVGVASVGNDPGWQDGGADGRWRTYWQSYSFGELSETARTRHTVLESLLPRLSTLRDRCSLTERFLVVKGSIRSYKIHLGSGNIMMEPNDQYLCIVPSRSNSNDRGTGKIYLPFEGDNTLSVILSKALLLADDDQIQEPTIRDQIFRML